MLFFPSEISQLKKFRRKNMNHSEDPPESFPAGVTDRGLNILFPRFCKLGEPRSRPGSLQTPCLRSVRSLFCKVTALVTSSPLVYLWIFINLCICMLCLNVCMGTTSTAGAHKGQISSRSPGTRYKWGEPPGGFWELNQSLTRATSALHC